MAEAKAKKGKIIVALVAVIVIVGGILFFSGDGGLFQGKIKYKKYTFDTLLKTNNF